MERGKVNLKTNTFVEFGMPEKFEGLEQSSLDDVSWYNPAMPPPPEGLHPGDSWSPGPDNPGWGKGELDGFGFWPIQRIYPEFNPFLQKMDSTEIISLNTNLKVIVVNYDIVDLTQEEILVLNPPKMPRDLSKLEFRNLLIDVVGAQTYQSFRSNEALFWANDTINCANIIRHCDIDPFVNEVKNVGSITQEQIDNLNASWPK